MKNSHAWGNWVNSIPISCQHSFSRFVSIIIGFFLLYSEQSLAQCPNPNTAPGTPGDCMPTHRNQVPGGFVVNPPGGPNDVNSDGFHDSRGIPIPANIPVANCPLTAGDVTVPYTVPNPPLPCDAQPVTFRYSDSESVFVTIWNRCVNPAFIPCDAGNAGGNFPANRQGFPEQLFCGVDALGLPSHPVPGAYDPGNSVSGVVTSFPVTDGNQNPGSIAAALDELGSACDGTTYFNGVRQDTADMIQSDFWLVLPKAVTSIAFDAGLSRSADGTSVYVGPDCNNMCSVASIFQTSGQLGVGVQGTSVSTYDVTGIPLTCGAVRIVRVRQYSTDFSANFNTTITLNDGNGPQAITAYNTIPATATDDCIPPDPFNLTGKGWMQVDTANGCTNFWSMDTCEYQPEACLEEILDFDVEPTVQAFTNYGCAMSSEEVRPLEESRTFLSAGDDTNIACFLNMTNHVGDVLTTNADCSVEVERIWEFAGEFCGCSRSITAREFFAFSPSLIR